MDSFGDHALLCSRQPSSASFQHRHRLVQRTLGTLLRQAGICHSVEPAHLRFSREKAPASGRGSGLTKPARAYISYLQMTKLVFSSLALVYFTLC